MKSPLKKPAPQKKKAIVTKPTNKKWGATKTESVVMPSLEFLATLGAQVMIAMHRPGTELRPDTAVKIAWNLIKEAEGLLQHTIPKDVAKILKSRAKPTPKAFKSAIRQITSEKPTDRSLEYFKNFLREESSKKGTPLNKDSEIWVKTYEQYQDEGISKNEITELQRLYQNAFPNRKKAPPSSPVLPLKPDRKITIDDEEIGEVTDTKKKILKAKKGAVSREPKR